MRAQTFSSTHRLPGSMQGYCFPLLHAGQLVILLLTFLFCPLSSMIPLCICKENLKPHLNATSPPASVRFRAPNIFVNPQVDKMPGTSDSKKDRGGGNRWAQAPSLAVRLNEACFFPQLAILGTYNSEHWRIITYIQFLPPSSALWHWKHAQPILTFSSPRAPVQAGWANKRLVTAKYGPTLAPARNFQPLWSQTHLHSSIWSKTLILWKICSLSMSCALTHAFKVSCCHADRKSVV